MMPFTVLEKSRTEMDLREKVVHLTMNTESEISLWRQVSSRQLNTVSCCLMMGIHSVNATITFGFLINVLDETF